MADDLLNGAVHLPSGAIVRVSASAVARAVAEQRAALRTQAPVDAGGRAGRQSRVSEEPHPACRDAPSPFAAALALLSAAGVLTSANGEALDVYTLPLRDVHTLRALLTRVGHLPEEKVPFTCENCRAPFDVAPSSLLEVGPFLDGELHDPELDAPFPFGEPQPIPRVLLPSAPRTGARRPSGFGAARGGRAATRSAPSTRAAPSAPSSGAAPSAPSTRAAQSAPSSRAAQPPSARAEARSADTVTFAERTADDARALFRAADAWLTGRSRAMRITPAVVLGMGIVALGSERRTSVIAEALAGASDAAWSSIVDLWLEAAYPRRLFGLHRCAECGARNDLDVPAAREWDREPAARAKPHKARDPFPDLDAFERRVRHHADRIYAARAVRNIDLIVDDGVPACDDGGEPLLGSYVPGSIDDALIPHPPEIRLYYRTFCSEYDADPTFDVDGEIAETIDHEIEHHLNHLGGVDPLDDEEHAAIDKEELCRIGVREAARRARRTLASDLAGFFKATWLLWVAMAIAALILWASQQGG